MVFVCLNIFLLFAGGYGDIYDKLKYYEALESAHVVSRKRRSADTDTRSMFIQEVSFQAFQRDFNLVLYPGSPVLAKDFEVKSVDGEGNIETFFPDLNNIFTGHLSDNHSIPVDAHYEDGILSCTIWCPDETYSVEPAWRHLPASTNGSMIVYRDSDIRWKNFELDSGPRCPDGVQLDPQINQNLSHVADDGNSSFHHDEHASERSKRQTIVKRACTLSVVSDFPFYYHVCGKSHQVCVAILISRINAADRIFRSTVWDAEKGFVDMGFQIKEIIVHREFTRKDRHFNSNYPFRIALLKLQAFSMVDGITPESVSAGDFAESFCLRHLFTADRFNKGVMGLAYTGAVCAAMFTIKSGIICSLNTGLTTVRNKIFDGISLTRMQALTTMHGHNWGSEHDTDNAECAPSFLNGGKYIMYPSVSQDGVNNERFSQCSKEWVRKRLATAVPICFTDEVPGEGICGNFMVDINEECDPGIVDNEDEDPCCTLECKLKKGAQCSDHNHSCCKNCTAAPNTTRCLDENPTRCEFESYCDGETHICPEPPPEPDGKQCFHGGKCYNGTCLSFCATYGLETNRTLKPCVCNLTIYPTSACKECCMDPAAEDDGCVPTQIDKAAGQPCLLGICDKDGKCIPSYDHVLRLGSYLKSVNVNNLVQILRRTFVIWFSFLSLMVWIPVSCCITLHDYVKYRGRKRRRLTLMPKFRRDTSRLVFFPQWEAKQLHAAYHAPSRQQARPYYGQSSQIEAPLYRTEAPPYRSEARSYGQSPRASSPYGQPSQRQATGPRGQSSQRQATSPHGQALQRQATSPQGQPSQRQATSPYGQPSQRQATSPHGQSSQRQATSPHGQALQHQAASPYRQSPQPQATYRAPQSIPARSYVPGQSSQRQAAARSGQSPHAQSKVHLAHSSPHTPQGRSRKPVTSCSSTSSSSS